MQSKSKGKRLWNKQLITKDLPFWVALNFFEGIGPLRFKVLLKYFKTAQNIYQADEQILSQAGFNPRLLEKFLAFRRYFNPKAVTEAILNGQDWSSLLQKQIVDADRLEQLNWVQNLKQYARASGPIQILIQKDPFYPEALRELDDAPFILYLRSNTQNLNLNRFQPSLTVVGTRKITGYGRQVTCLITAQLVQAGLTIVSGLAAGVDSLAHQTALDNNGQTIAVLGSGVDTVFPLSNKELYQKIIQSGRGAVVSEFPPGFPPLPGNFPSRNRIVAGFSLGTLVIEGADKSGSLITARLAAEYGKEVFAVPGPITSPMSAAATRLLKNGAKLATSANDILEELPRAQIQSLTLNLGGSRLQIKSLPLDEQKIFKALENENLHFDEISRTAKISADKLGSLLSLMEVKGLVQNFGQMLYGLKSL